MSPEFASRTYTSPYTLRPISDRTGFLGRPTSGDRNPFKATWTATQSLLARELYELRARRVVLELDIREQDIRQDGGPRANAVTRSTAVRLSFETADGPLVFATDRYGYDYRDQPKSQGWQDNLRAIALGLEALRKVDRYGITQRREQYRGFLAIESGAGVAPSGMTTELAVEVLCREANAALAADAILAQGSVETVYAQARRNSHPDRNHGDRSRWDAVEQAGQVLRRNGLLP